MRVSFVIAYLLVVLLPLQSRGHFYKQYTTREGFISNDVYHIVRDREGNLWFCTTKGVVKYNGLSFKKFTISDGLTDNDVFSCFEDSKNRIWFYTYNGKYCYYKKGVIYNPDNDTLLKNISSSQRTFISAIYEDAEAGILYIGHAEGPILKLKGSTVKIIKPDFGSGDILRLIYQQNKTIRVLSSFHSSEIAGDDFVNSIAKKKYDSYFYNDRLITADEEGIKLFENERLIWRVDNQDVSLSDIYHLYYDGNDNIFCGTRKGLIVYNIKNNRRLHYFQNIRITSTTQDIHGNYWLSSFGNGAYRLNRAEIGDVKLIADIRSHDLILTKGGQIFLKKDNVFEFLKTENNGFRVEVIPVKLNRHMEPVYLTDKFFFYYGVGPGDGFCAYNRRSGKTTINRTAYFSEAYRIDSNRFLFLNTLTLYAVSVVNDTLDISYMHKFEGAMLSEYYSNETQGLFFFSKNILYQYDAPRMKLRAIDTVQEIGGNNIILLDNNRLIVIVNNKHVSIYSLADNPHKITHMALPFPIYSMVKAGADRYLINTDKGYEILDALKLPFSIATQKIVYPFQQKDILFLHPYGNGFVCKVRDELYGFSADILNKHPSIPNLSIDKILLNNKQTNDKHVVTNNKTDVRIILSPVYFSDNRLKYKYRITESNTAGPWFFTQSEELNFLFNSPGDYVIEMQALASNRILSNIEMVRLTIKPSFFSSLLFYLGCTVFVFLAVITLFHLYLRRRRIIFNNEMNFLQLEHKSINSLLNPHFIFNTINNIQGLINKDSKEQASEYLATLSVMIRQNIENLQYNFITLEKELNLVSNYIELQNLRFDSRIDYTSHCNAAVDIFIPPLLIHTFVENSIVHGYSIKKDRFKIEVKIDMLPDRYLKISILDNGCGFENGKEQIHVQKDKTSMGIAFTRKRLKRLSEFYKVHYLLELKDRLHSDKVVGTEVTIIFYSGFKELVKTSPSLPAY